MQSEKARYPSLVSNCEIRPRSLRSQHLSHKKTSEGSWLSKFTSGLVNLWNSVVGKGSHEQSENWQRVEPELKVTNPELDGANFCGEFRSNVQHKLPLSFENCKSSDPFTTPQLAAGPTKTSPITLNSLGSLGSGYKKAPVFSNQQSLQPTAQTASSSSIRQEPFTKDIKKLPLGYPETTNASRKILRSEVPEKAKQKRLLDQPDEAMVDINNPKPKENPLENNIYSIKKYLAQKREEEQKRMNQQKQKYPVGIAKPIITKPHVGSLVASKKETVAGKLTIDSEVSKKLLKSQEEVLSRKFDELKNEMNIKVETLIMPKISAMKLLQTESSRTDQSIQTSVRKPATRRPNLEITTEGFSIFPLKGKAAEKKETAVQLSPISIKIPAEPAAGLSEKPKPAFLFPSEVKGPEPLTQENEKTEVVKPPNNDLPAESSKKDPNDVASAASPVVLAPLKDNVERPSTKKVAHSIKKPPVATALPEPSQAPPAAPEEPKVEPQPPLAQYLAPEQPSSQVDTKPVEPAKPSMVINSNPTTSQIINQNPPPMPAPLPTNNPFLNPSSINRTPAVTFGATFAPSSGINYLPQNKPLEVAQFPWAQQKPSAMEPPRPSFQPAVMRPNEVEMRDPYSQPRFPAFPATAVSFSGSQSMETQSMMPSQQPPSTSSWNRDLFGLGPSKKKDEEESLFTTERRRIYRVVK